jgi:hypothetical protein
MKRVFDRSVIAAVWGQSQDDTCALQVRFDCSMLYSGFQGEFWAAMGP